MAAKEYTTVPTDHDRKHGIWSRSVVTEMGGIKYVFEPRKRYKVREEVGRRLVKKGMLREVGSPEPLFQNPKWTGEDGKVYDDRQLPHGGNGVETVIAEEEATAKGLEPSENKDAQNAPENK